MSAKKSLVQAIIERTQVVPSIGVKLDNPTVDTERVSRQLDIALISAGFKAESSLLNHIASLAQVDAVQLSKEVVSAVKTLVGDHVKHNVYFKSFPDNVPETIEFWTELIEKTYGSTEEAPIFINLLDLDGYGKYLHSYEDMVKAHAPFVEKLSRELKVIKLGKTFQQEADSLFISLAESAIPLNDIDKELLAELSTVASAMPTKIPVRENKAIVNKILIEKDSPIVVDTVGDIMRLAAFLSGGDVTLQTPTHYSGITKKQRKALLNGFDSIAEQKLVDVKRYAEQFKRLNYYLHGTKRKSVQTMLEIISKNTQQTFEGKVEKAFIDKDVSQAISLLEKMPGHLIKNINRLVMNARMVDMATLFKGFEGAVGKTSTRAILSLRQYLENRNVEKLGRLFVNKKGGTYVVQEKLETMPEAVLEMLKGIIDAEVSRRYAESNLKIDSSILHYAIPVSDKQRNNGLKVVPRGTETFLDPQAEVLRFFVYWKENNYRTDYDLSVILLDENFAYAGQVSYTNLREIGAVHSGDITSAPRGASEFIDIELAKVKAKYVIPQINVFSGNNFDEAKEAFFGYMLRSLEEKGKPFEPKTVETKSDLFSTNRIGLPMVFVNTEDGWKAKQLNVFLKGHPMFNATENNFSSTQVLIQSIVNDSYLTLEYLAEKLPDIDETEEKETKKITHVNLHEAILE